MNNAILNGGVSYNLDYKSARFKEIRTTAHPFLNSLLGYFTFWSNDCEICVPIRWNSLLSPCNPWWAEQNQYKFCECNTMMLNLEETVSTVSFIAAYLTLWNPCAFSNNTASSRSSTFIYSLSIHLWAISTWKPLSSLKQISVTLIVLNLLLYDIFESRPILCLWSQSLS